MTLLDLLSTLGSMRLSGESSLKEAVQVITGHEDYFLHRRFLEGLGHARIDRVDGKIHVLAPRLVALPREDCTDCVAALAGARNPDLLRELEYQATSHNITIDRKNLGDSLPERITLRGTASALREIANKAVSLPLDIADDPSVPDAWRLLSAVPSLQFIMLGFTSETTGIARGEPLPSAEVFNPATGYYDPWLKLGEAYPSSYILARKSAYDYRLAWWQPSGEKEGDGAWIQRLSPLELDTFWARWAVVYSADPANALPSISEEGIYKVPRIAPLPMELHRVCCLCSGFPPEEHSGFYNYKNVPPIIQQGVNDRLRLENPLPQKI
jgi:hypothetical protein